VVRANPNSSASRARVVRNSNKDSKADKVDLAKAAQVKAAPVKVARVASVRADPHKVVQVVRANPNSSASRARVVRRSNKAGQDNRVFPVNKGFPSKVARGRKACPVRAGPINSATEAPLLVRKADE